MSLFELFESALPLSEFLTRYGNDADRERWGKKIIVVDNVQKTLLAAFTRKINVLVIAGTWCGDCAAQCPIFEAFAAVSKQIQIRYVDRDANTEPENQVYTNGGKRVPAVIFFSEDGHEAARYGERTLSGYRRQAISLLPDSPITAPEDWMKATIQEWLNEFERVHWMLRLSSRLRDLHKD